MMQNVFRSFCLAIGVCAVTLPAQAADYWHPYAGAGVGSILIDAGLGSKQAFGGYGMVGNDFNDNVGVEVRVGSSGSTSGTELIPQGTVGETQRVLLVPTPAKVGIDWFVAYLLKLQYPVSPLFRVYGVVGATTMKAKFSLPGITVRGKTTTSFSFGGGFDYGLGEQWRVGVDATVYSNKANTSPGANFSGLDVWGIAATAKYGF